MSEPSELLAEIQAQLTLEPFNAQLYQELGKLQLKAGRSEAARAALERAIILDPTDPWSHLYLGNYFYGKAAYNEAIAEYRRAHRVAPELAMPLVCIADAYHSLDEIALADKYYRGAVEVDPDDEIARENLQRWKEIWNNLPRECGDHPADDGE